MIRNGCAPGVGVESHPTRRRMAPSGADGNWWMASGAKVSIQPSVFPAVSAISNFWGRGPPPRCIMGCEARGSARGCGRRRTAARSRDRVVAFLDALLTFKLEVTPASTTSRPKTTRKHSEVHCFLVKCLVRLPRNQPGDNRSAVPLGGDEHTDPRSKLRCRRPRRPRGLWSDHQPRGSRKFSASMLQNSAPCSTASSRAM